MKIISIVSVLFFLGSTFCFSQELKLKKKRTGEYLEKFYVLKENKTVKHGQYVRYRINSFNYKGIESIGHYYNGKKEGNWFYFGINGYLLSEGSYRQDQKSGLWIQFYPVNPSDSNNLVRLTTVFDVNKGISMSGNGEIIIDRAQLIKCSEGVYLNNHKTGAWNYYNSEGHLIHKFDHTTSQLLTNNYVFPTDSLCPYLGGCSRFYKEYGTHSVTLPKEATSFTLEISPEPNTISIKILTLNGNSELAQEVKTILTEIDNDFLFQNNESIIFNFKSEGYTGGMFSKFSIYFGDKNANKY